MRYELALPADAPKRIGNRGLSVRRAPTGAREYVIVQSGGFEILLLELVPMGDDTWDVEVPDPTSTETAVRRTVRRLVSGVEGMHPTRRLDELATQLKRLELELKAGDRRGTKRKVRLDVPDEDLHDPLHPLQGGAPGMRQQRGR